MNIIKMTSKNVDGKTIEKDIEENLVPIYEVNGWEVKKKDVKLEVEKNDKSTENVSETINKFSRRNVEK